MSGTRGSGVLSSTGDIVVVVCPLQPSSSVIDLDLRVGIGLHWVWGE